MEGVPECGGDFTLQLLSLHSLCVCSFSLFFIFLFFFFQHCAADHYLQRGMGRLQKQCILHSWRPVREPRGTEWSQLQSLHQRTEQREGYCLCVASSWH